MKTKQKHNYERYGSHTHCWNQKQPSSCGQPLEKHTRCCLCDVGYIYELMKEDNKTENMKCCPLCESWPDYDKHDFCHNKNCKCHLSKQSGKEEEYVESLDEIIRSNLIWYRENGSDHGDLVIAEEAIIEAIKSLLAEQREQIRNTIINEIGADKMGITKDKTKKEILIDLLSILTPKEQ